ncbi:MAG: NUDIX domain-containing protein [Candidatus Promineifilaceae bacterium]|jgi:8-oxo-dGTP pyrophosphatase MutT (NUDIX family)
MLSYVDWLRKQIGHGKVFLPFATVILRDEAGRVLLQKRTDFTFWGLPGGVLEMEEDIETGARRELLEETGLTVGELRLVGIYTDPKYDIIYPNGDQVQQFTFCLEGRMSGGRMMPDGQETTEQLFVPMAEVDQYPLPIWYSDMLVEAEMKGAPRFRAPNNPPETNDQIAAVRPFVGHERFAGMGSAMVLDREDGKLIMLQHKGEEFWRIPSGFCNLGENAAQTAVREAKEELGLDIAPDRIIGVHSTTQLNTTYANGDRIRNVGVVFHAQVTGGTLALDPVEIAEMAWMSPQETLASVHPTRREHYKAVLRHQQAGYFIT